jgi:hypothetical protein
LLGDIAPPYFSSDFVSFDAINHDVTDLYWNYDLIANIGLLVGTIP